MPCLDRVKAFRVEGQTSLVFGREPRDATESLLLPCGKCIFCIQNTAQQWAVRSAHEAMTSNGAPSIFATFTYDDDHLPEFGSVSRRDFQLLIKRLRKQRGEKIRYDGCAEYGGLSLRAHGHLSIFGYWPSDAKPYGKTGAGLPQYESQELTDLWGLGRVTFSPFSFATAMYVSGYTLKKFAVTQAELSRPVFDPRTGKSGFRESPFGIHCQRPALGLPFMDRYAEDVFGDDKIMLEGKPRGRVIAYDKWLLERDPDRFYSLKDARLRSALAGITSDEDRRLLDKSYIFLDQLQTRARAAV